MAAPVNATINVLANTDQAVAQFRALQAQVASLNKTVSATSGAAAAQQAAMARALMDGANASRMWSARVVPMNTAVNQFSDALDKGRMSLGQYTRYAASQLPGMSRVFKREFDMMSRVAEQNVRRMQTQYMALGNSATGAAQAMAFTPTALNKQAAATQIAAQRQMMMNRMIDLGTTKLLNWGKNTQWAGRQLMVGFSIPLAMMGAAAAKAFKEIDKGTIAFKRVYGDLQTTTAEMEKNLDAVKELGVEYTRYGKSLASTIELAADVAATGARNETLIAATEQTIRLATLGLMEYDEALGATVALQTAFQISNEDLAGTIDFLNVVENETILTMQDMAAAIPRVAPVIKGLGGDVKDLAVFMTALREGGVTAEQGANALKSGLGRLINPTKAAREEAEKYGISIEQIVQRNRGDLMGTVTEFGDAISALGQLEQQQVLQKVFGTYQYARLGALFRNLSNDAGQAQRTMELTSMSVEDLAKISERELSKIEEATSVKFQASIEKLKIAIAPIGETFMKALMPVIDFISKILNAFNDLPDNVKNIIAIVIGAIAGIGPIVLMTVGLIANGIANIGKLIQTMRKFFARLKGDARLFDYLTKEEQEATAAANGLSGATEKLTGRFLGQQKALERLITLVGQYAQALGTAAAAAPLGMGVGTAAMATRAMGGGRGTIVTGPQARTIVSRPPGFQQGVVGVPGTGRGDKIPALLEPGESVVTRDATQRYAPVIAAMNAGTLPGFVQGVMSLGGVPVPAPVAGYNIRSSSVAPVESIIGKAKAIDGGLDAVTAVLREFAQTGKLISKRSLELALQAQGVSLKSPTSPMYSQAAGTALVRSHAMGLGPQTLVPNFLEALKSANPIIRQHAQEMLQSIKGVEIVTSKNGLLAKEITETSQIFDMLQRSTSGVTAGFRGTAMVSPPQLNELYNRMPANLKEGESLSLKTFQQQVKWAESEFKKLAATLGVTTAELADDAFINQQLDNKQKEYLKGLNFLIKEGQDVTNARMTEEQFLKSRIKQIGLAIQVENGQKDATIANTKAEQFATQQIELMRRAGIIATDATIDYAQAMQMLAASAVGQGRTLITGGAGVNQQFVKRSAQRLSPSGSLPEQRIQNLKSIPTSTIPKAMPLTANALALGANRFAPMMTAEGTKLGAAMGTGMVQGASQAASLLVPAVIKASGHNSAHPLMGTTGTQDGTAYGNSWNSAVRKAIMTGSGAILPLVPPGGGRPPVAAPRPPGGEAARNAAAVKAAIAGLGKDVVAPVKPQLTAGLKQASSEFTTHVRNAVSALGMGISDAAKPFTKPIIDSAQKAAAKVKSAYETAAIKTMLALDSVKAMPKQVGQAVTQTRGRLMNMLQTMVPQNVGRRVANRAFYGAQDMLGRARAAGGMLLNPVPRALAMDIVRQVGMDKLGKMVSSTTGRIKAFAGQVSKAGQIIMNPVPRAIAMAAIMDKTVKPALTTMGNVVEGTKAKLSAFGSAVAKGAQILINPVPRALAITVMQKKLAEAGQAILTATKTKFNEALTGAKTILTQGFNNLKTVMTTSVKNVKQVFDNAKGTLKQSLDNLKAGISLAATEMKKAANSAGKMATEAGTALKTAIKNTATQVATAGKALGTAVKGAAAQAATAAAGYFGKVDERTGRTRGQRMASGGNTAVMGLMGISMAASFLEGEMGELAQKIMPVTMGLMGLQMLLPMLKSPFGIATLAVAALAGSFIKARMDIDKAAREASDAGANIGGVANQLQIISEATGLEIMTPEDRLFRFSKEDREAMGEFSSFFEGERGSKFVEDLKKMSSEERYKNVAKMLTTAIANGLSPEKAEAFGSAIAEATGDYILNSRILADIRAGRIGGGSEALIEMARERLELAPQVPGSSQVGVATRLGGALGGGGGMGDAERFRQVAVGSGSAFGAVAGRALAQAAVPRIAAALTARAAGAAIGAAVGSVLPGLGTVIGLAAGFGIGFAIDKIMTSGDREKITSATEQAGKALGFSLQMIQDLSNAEAVLAEERRQGKVTIDEAKEREAEIKELQQQVTDYFVSLFGEGTDVDTNALKQAMRRQLAYQGFTEQQQDLIIEDLDINRLAQEYFGEESYADLNQTQRDFISNVYQQVLTGLTPENLDQRMQDVTGTWKTVAQRYIEAIEAGLDPSEAFQRIGVEQWAASTFGEESAVGTAEQEGRRAATEFNLKNRKARLEELEKERRRQEGLLASYSEEQEMDDEIFGGRSDEAINADMQAARLTIQEIDAEIAQTQASIDQFAKELVEVDTNASQAIASNTMGAIDAVNQTLEAAGNAAVLTEQEFLTAASKFRDQDFLQNLLETENGAKRLAEAVVALRDFPDIDIELFLRDENFNPEKLKSELEKMKDINLVFDPKIVGGKKAAKDMKAIGAAVLPDPQEYANVLQQMKVPTDEFFSTYQKNSIQLVESLSKFPELISKKTGKVKLSGEFLFDVFGGNVDNPDALAARLNNAFPDRLSPIQMMIMVGLGGPGAALLAQAQEDPELKKAIMAGTPGQAITYGGKTVSSPYGAYTTGATTVDPGTAALIRSFFNAPTGGVPTGSLPDDTTGSSSGASEKEKTALEELEESIAERTALYLSVTKKGQKLDKAKKGYLNRLAAETTANNSIASQLAKLNLSETLIADILAMGSKKAAEIIKQLGPSGLRRLNVGDIASRTGLFLEGQRSARKREEYKNIARTELEQTGQFSEEEIEEILEDEEATELLATLPKKYTKLWKEFIQSLRATADATAEVESAADKANREFDEASDRLEKLNDMMRQGFDAAELEAADKVAAKFFTDNNKLAEGLAKSTGHTISNGYQLVEAMERQVSLNERLIDQEQDKIDKKQEEINDYERTNALIQQGIDNLRRNDELRNRRSESLSRDLEQISQAEEKIREKYQERIAALDKVAKINDHLIQQQQKQLDLSRAISEGDIYAATQAAQQMRAASAQQAAEQTRLGLERGMEAEIENLTNAEGKTRVEIEAEINNIKEQNYQNSLLIRIEEDKIYKNNLEIRRLSNEIYDIQEGIIEPLQNQNKEYARMLDYYKQDSDYQISRITLAGMTRDQFEKQADALALSVRNARDLDPELLTLVGRYDAIANAARGAAAAAASIGTGIAASQYTGPVIGQPTVGGTYTGIDLSGLTPDMFGGMDFSNLNLDFSGLNLGFGFNSGGMVLGEGSRDSISAMLTPGEYVIRKAMVDKYGIPLMEALNQGSFAMPTYNTGPEVPEIGAVNMNNISNVNAPVYNTYDMKFSISGTNQSADEIANKVMFKMKQLQSQGVRSNRGY